MEKPTCPAHDLLVKSVDEVRESTSEIYGLLRKAADETGEANVRIATIEILQRTGFENINKRLTDSERQAERIEQKLAEQSKNIMLVLHERRKPRWTPAQVLAIVSAIIGPSGIAAWAAFIK